MVMNVGNKLIKCATDTVFRVAITRCKIILSKQAGLEAEICERISGNSLPRPSPDAVRTKRANLAGGLGIVIQRFKNRAGKTNADGLLVEVTRHALLGFQPRRQAPKDKWLDDRLRDETIEFSVK